MIYFGTTKESGETPTSAFIDAILDLARRDSRFWQAYTGLPARAYPLYTAPGIHHAMKVRYSIDNPVEVGSTAVYPPS